MTRWLVTCDAMAEIAFRVGPAVKWISGITEQTTCKVRRLRWGSACKVVRPNVSGVSTCSLRCASIILGFMCLSLYQSVFMVSLVSLVFSGVSRASLSVSCCLCLLSICALPHSFAMFSSSE